LHLRFDVPNDRSRETCAQKENQRELGESCHLRIRQRNAIPMLRRRLLVENIFTLQTAVFQPAQRLLASHFIAISIKSTGFRALSFFAPAYRLIPHWILLPFH
jgi:hypothetical protein